MAGPWEKYGSASPAAPPSGPWSKYSAPGAGQDEIVNQYANEILRRNEIYRTIPQEQLADPERLYKLATLEAERNGFKPVQPMDKQDRGSSFVTGYGQGGTFGFADELSGAVDFVGGAGMGVLRGEGLGAIESGKKAYSDRVEKDRRILRQARADNPVTALGGELAGGIVTYAPAPAGWMGAGARTTSQVAAQSALKADKLNKLAQTGSGLLRANRASRATNLSAKAAALSRPAANAGEAAARFGGRVAESIGKGAGYGAGYGALYGFGSGEGDAGERLDDAARGAAFGAVGGAVLSPAAQFVLAPIAGKVGYSLFTSLDNKAIDRVLERAARSGTSLEQVQADFAKWSKSGEVPETLAELMGPHERSLLSAMITVNRETEERAGQVLLGRGKKEVDRLEKSFARAMGAERGDFAGAKAAAQKARSEDPEAFYQAAHYEPNGQRRFLDEKQTQAVSYEVSKSRVAKSTLSGASDYADARGLYAVRDEIDDFARALEAGKPPQRLSVEAADYIERSINQRYKSARSGATQDIPAGIKSLRDRMRGIIDTTGLGKARETAAEAIRRGELLDEGRKFMKTDVDVEDINNTLRGNPELDIDPASPAGQQAYTVGAARAIADKLRDTQNMKGFADATRAVARTPAIREKISAVLPQKLTKKGVPSKAARQTRLNNELDEAIERTADRADFTNTMLGNSRTAFRQGAVDDALADDHISSAVGEGVRDLLMGGPGNVFQQAAGKFAKGVGARIGQPGIMRPGLNRKMADILLATDKDIPVQLARLARRAAQRGMARVTMRGLPPPPAGSAPSSPPTSPPAGGSPAGPIKASGFGAVGRDAAGGAFGGAILPMPSTGDPEEDMKRRLMLMGTMAVGAGAGPRMVGAARNALASGGRTVGAPRVAGQGLPNTPAQAAKFETPGSPEWEAAKAKGLDMSQAGRMARRKAWEAESHPEVKGADWYHGTTHDFDSFSPTGNPEGHHGGGAYFSSSPDDVARNYASTKGPDLTNRIEQRAERLSYDIEEAVDKADYAALEAMGISRSKLDGPGIDFMEEARRIAKSEIAGKGEGATIRAAVRAKNPVVVNGSAGKPYTYMGKRYNEPQAAKGKSTFWEMDSGYDEALDEFGDPSGPAYDLIEAVRRRLDDAGMRDTDSIIGQLFDEASVNGGLYADDFERIIRNADDMIDYDLSPGQVIQDAYKALGHDGIVLRNAERQFGNMGMNPDTTHLVIFDPSNIRSVNAAFDPDKAASPILTAGFPGGRRGRPPGSPKPNGIANRIKNIAMAPIEGAAATAQAASKGVSQIAKDVRQITNEPLGPRLGRAPGDPSQVELPATPAAVERIPAEPVRPPVGRPRADNPDQAITNAAERIISGIRARLASVDDPRQYGPRMASYDPPQRLDPSRSLYDQVGNTRQAARDITATEPGARRGIEYAQRQQAARVGSEQNNAARRAVITAKQAATKERKAAKESLDAFYGTQGEHTSYPTAAARRAEEARRIARLQRANAAWTEAHAQPLPDQRVVPSDSEQKILQEARKPIPPRAVRGRAAVIEGKANSMLLDPDMATAGVFSARAAPRGFAPPRRVSQAAGYAGLGLGIGGGSALGIAGINALADKSRRASEAANEHMNRKAAVPGEVQKPKNQWGGLPYENRTTLQATLNYVNGKSAQIPVDGGWGEKTKGAVKMAQEKLGLPVTGVVDDATLAALNEQTEIRMFEYRQKLEQKSASQRLQ